MKKENINIRIGRGFLKEGRDKSFVLKQMEIYKEQLGMLSKSKEVDQAKKELAEFIAELKENDD